MNFSIVYSTTYEYDQPVSEQHNILRVMPASTDTQRVHSFELSVEPAAHLYRHRDYFGTETVSFNVAARHERLEIEARSRVSTIAPSPPPQASPDGIEDDSYRREAGEFLLPWSRVGAADRLAEIAAEVRASTPLETVNALCTLIPERFEYRPGVTYVGSTIDDLLAGGAGVCQDFVHLALAVLRRESIGARYVSGYLFAPGENGRRSAEVETHAWIEALLPGEDGGEPRWVGADPTNSRLAGEEHVKIGHGRHYADVPPIRGVYGGQAHADSELSVHMIHQDRDP
jgi:transglutaminase-like putative cysteine protease